MKRIILLLCLVQYLGFSQINDSKYPILNGPVYAVASDGEFTYLGGNFTVIAPFSGNGVEMSTSVSDYNINFPKISGKIFTSIDDGNGGWYIGGEFTSIDNVPRNNIAHILSDGSVDDDFDPNANGVVTCLEISSEHIYAGGRFTQIGSTPRNFIAKLDKETGQADDNWNANASDPIHSIKLLAQDIFVGGEFTNIGGQIRNFSAKLSTIDGSANGLWDPNFNGIVRDIHIWNTLVFCVGDFTNSDGNPAIRIAKLNSQDASLQNWASPAINNNVYSIDIHGNEAYVSGIFSDVNGEVRTGVAKINAVSGDLDLTWKPILSEYRNQDFTEFENQIHIRSIEVINSGVFIASNTIRLNGGNGFYLVKTDLTNGLIDPEWETYMNGPVFSIQTSVDERRIFAGGTNSYNAGKIRFNLAKINNSTGNIVQGWKPNPNNIVRSISLDSESLYMAGDFTNAGGSTRNYLAKVSTDEGAIDGLWDPNANQPCYDIQSTSDAIYVIGGFDQIYSNTMSYLAKVTKATGTVDQTWQPNPNGELYSISVTPNSENNGNDIYVSGTFTSIGGQNRNYVAKLNDTDGNADPSWKPTPDGPVTSVKATANNVFVGGDFTIIGQNFKNNIAKLNTSDGKSDDTWDPNSDGIINTFELNADESAIYAAGEFTSIGGAARNFIVKLNNTDGSADSDWNPNPNSEVDVIYTYQDDIFVGGDFTEMSGINDNREYIARFVDCQDVTNNLTASACESYEYNSKTYTESQEITEVFKTYQGCDSTVVIDLTINLPSEPTSFTKNACSYFEFNSKTFTETGEYTEILSNVNGCDSAVTVNLTMIEIDTTVTKINDFTLVVNQQDFISYQWVDCDNGFEPVQGAVSNVFSPEEIGNYACQLSFDNCTELTSCYSLITASIGEPGEISDIYPNPNDNDFSIQLEKEYSNVRISIFDLNGRLSFEKEYSVFTEQTINTDLSIGSYLVYIYSNETLIGVDKLIVQ